MVVISVSKRCDVYLACEMKKLKTGKEKNSVFSVGGFGISYVYTNAESPMQLHATTTAPFLLTTNSVLNLYSPSNKDKIRKLQ